jgi:hypothetical protein
MTYVNISGALMKVIVGQNCCMNFSNFTELWAFEIQK